MKQKIDNKKIEWVISELDNVLINVYEKNSHNPEEKRLLNEILDKGILFTVSTWRSIRDTEEIISKLFIPRKKTYLICNNGAAIYSPINRKLIAYFKINENNLERLEHIFKRILFDYDSNVLISIVDFDSEISLFTDDVEKNEINIQKSNLKNIIGTTVFKTINSISKLKKRNILSVNIEFFDNIKNIHKVIETLVKNDSSFNYMIKDKKTIIITEKNVNKLFAVKYLLDHDFKNLNNNNILVVADSLLDICLVNYFEKSICSEMSPTEIKDGSIAKFIGSYGQLSTRIFKYLLDDEEKM